MGGIAGRAIAVSWKGNTMSIHSTAIIEDGAIIGEDNVIGPYTYIGSQVVIGDGNHIGPFCTIGKVGQHSSEFYELADNYKHNGVVIGNRNVIREYTSVHYPLSETTVISDDCYIMAYNHISHDTVLKNKVILANNCQIAGYTTIFEGANLGLSAVIHQYSTIGALAMVGAASMISRDIPPFSKCFGNPVASHGLNTVGLVRKGYSKDQIRLITLAYENRQLLHLKEDALLLEKYSEYIQKSRRKRLFELV